MESDNIMLQKQSFFRSAIRYVQLQLLGIFYFGNNISELSPNYSLFSSVTPPDGDADADKGYQA